MAGAPIIDLTGQQFGAWTVVERGGYVGSQAGWLCVCSCGRVKKRIAGGELRRGNTRGCLFCRGDSDRIDITGQRFGRLTVLSRSANDSKGRTYWLCECDCGVEKSFKTKYLRNGDTKSCGCLVIDTITKHGLSKTPEYLRALWASRRARKRNASGPRLSSQDITKQLDRQHYRCYACNEKLRKGADGGYIYHIDHWVALINGGDNSLNNLRILHPFCNLSKNGLTLQQYAKRQGMLLVG